MKIDFYAPKKYYGTHLISLFGYLNIFLFVWMNPYGEIVCSNGGSLAVLLMLLINVFFLLIIILFFMFELFFNSKVRNNFFLNNNVYDLIFDIGMVLSLLPLVWFQTECQFDIKPFVFLFCLFLLIRALKFFQCKKGKESV